MVLEEQLESQGGEITEELDIIWQAKDMELKDKIDAYGYTLAELDAEEAKIKSASTLIDDRIKKALGRIESLRKKLKTRLNIVAEDKPLRGHIFNFHPFTSTRSFIEKPEMLKPEETYLTIEIKESIWNLFKAAADNAGADWLSEKNFKIKDRKGKVSELPKDHPAIGRIEIPSVTTT